MVCHQARLALEGQVRDGVLVEGDFDREAQRVPATVDGAHWGRAPSRRGAAAGAHVLLPLDLDDLVLQLDDVDHLRALDLARQRL
jgi:hypothetical protein